MIEFVEVFVFVFAVTAFNGFIFRTATARARFVNFGSSFFLLLFLTVFCPLWVLFRIGAAGAGANVGVKGAGIVVVSSGA